MTAVFKFDPPVIAHRGASAYAPENTMVAFTKAAQMGIRWIEFDVMQANDGSLVIFHDEELDRTTNGKGHLAAYPYAHLQSLDAGRWFHPLFSGEKIPSFWQMLVFLKETSLSANIELKPVQGQDEMLVVRVLNEIKMFVREYGSLPQESLLFSCFSYATLRLLRLHAPDCLIGLLLDEWNPEWLAMCQALDCVSIHLNDAVISEKKTRTIKSANIQLLVYTVNSPLRALELYRWGVDAFFTDVPDKIFAILDESIKGHEHG